MGWFRLISKISKSFRDREKSAYESPNLPKKKQEDSVICGNCRGNGHVLIRIEKEDGLIIFEPEDCPECLGVGEIQSESTPTYPDSHGSDDY